MRIGKIGLLALLVVCCAVCFDQAGAAANWPRFHGPNGTGISEDKGVPVTWSAADGILWKTAIPGVGHSSPIVWDNRVFLQSSTTNGKERLLLCVDARSGKILWSRSLPGSTAQMNALNSLASSTPATDGKQVYAMIWDGKDVALHAYDFEGKHLWQHDLGSFTSQHGPGASPIAYDGKVIFANDQDARGERGQNVPHASVLVALDGATGKVVWQTERKPFRACYSAPFLMERSGDKPQLVVVSTTGITGYDPQTGTEAWNWIWKFTTQRPLRTTGSPTHSGNMIFANSGDGNGDRHMVAVQVEAKGDSTKTSLVWQNKRDLPYVPSMLVYGDHLYSVNDLGIAACRVARTGELVWSERLAGKATASPIIIDGKVYAITDTGDVYVFPAAAQFKLLARNTLGEAVRATPAVSDGRLFIRGRSHLFCIGGRPTK